MSGKAGTGNKGIRVFLVGLTGNFGTGKSTVARIFKKLGVPVVSADRLAHEVFQKQNPLYPKVRSLFRESKGVLTRAKVARIVFQNPRKRRALESLVHPYVFDRIGKEIRRRRKKILMVEVPLLFESGFHRRCDSIIVVQTRAKKVLERLQARGFAKDEVRARWRAQRTVGEKLRGADYLIDNSDGLGRTRRQVIQIWRRIERSLSTHGERQR